MKINDKGGHISMRMNNSIIDKSTETNTCNFDEWGHRRGRTILRCSVFDNFLDGETVILLGIRYSNQVTEKKFHNFRKNVDSTTVISDKIDGMTVISNLLCMESWKHGIRVV